MSSFPQYHLDDAEAAAQCTANLLPPGTVRLVDQGPSHPDHIILVPEPSKHPDDPLNWPKWRKILNITLVFVYTFTTGVGGTSTYSVLTNISDDTGITLTQLNLGTGFIFLLAGWGNLIWQPAALTFGRRPVFLLSILGVAAISEWTAWIDSFPQWAAARILYGFMVAPVEVLPEISIPDIFFAHERGTYVGIYSMTLCASNFIAPLIAGFMNDSIGWRWVQHWCAILLGLNFIVAFFLQEESMWKRRHIEAQSAKPAGATASLEGQTEKAVSEEKTATTTQTDSSATSSVPSVRPTDTSKTYVEKLALWSDSALTWRQCLRTAYRPILIFFQFPNIMWAGFIYAFTNSWYGVYNATASAILSAPPYNYSSSKVGLTYIAPLFGALVAGVFAGPFADWYTLRLARRNGGIREPEQRLVGLAAYSILMPVGLILWGVGAAHELNIGVLLVGSVFCGFCIVTGGSFAIAYAVDCFKEIAGESLVSVILCRNTLTFGFSYAVTPWIAASGLQNTFIASSILSCVIGSTFLLMMWKGKELRIWSTARYWRYAATQVASH